MKITLPEETLTSLPAPDSEGLIRVTAALRVNAEDGSVEIVEVNDAPVPVDEPEEDEVSDYEAPSLDEATEAIYGQ